MQGAAARSCRKYSDPVMQFDLQLRLDTSRPSQISCAYVKTLTGKEIATNQVQISYHKLRSQFSIFYPK